MENSLFSVRELKYHENFHERSYDTLLFVLVTKSFIVLTTFAKLIRSRKVQKPKAAAKDQKVKRIICESSTLPSSYFASMLIVKYFANNTARIRYNEKFLLYMCIYTD